MMDGCAVWDVKEGAEFFMVCKGLRFRMMMSFLPTDLILWGCGRLWWGVNWSVRLTSLSSVLVDNSGCLNLFNWTKLYQIYIFLSKFFENSHFTNPQPIFHHPTDLNWVLKLINWPLSKIIWCMKNLIQIKFISIIYLNSNKI